MERKKNWSWFDIACILASTLENTKVYIPEEVSDGSAISQEEVNLALQEFDQKYKSSRYAKGLDRD